MKDIQKLGLKVINIQKWGGLKVKNVQSRGNGDNM